MEYNDITKLKSALSNSDDELKKLYAAALAQNEAAYKNAKAELEKQHAADRTQATVDSMVSRRNTAQLLTSRGLANSGESMQSELNENLALSDRLAKLDEQHFRDLNSALEKKNSEDLGALKDYTSSANKAASSASADSTDTEGKYVPEISVKEMAKNLLSNIGSKGQINNAYENASLKLKIEKLKAENNLSDDYIKELELLLKTNGYYDMSLDYAQAYAAAEYAKKKADNWTMKIYQKLVKSDEPRKAKLEAQHLVADQQLAYLYTHCGTPVAFRKACTLCGFDKERIDAYIKIAENSPNIKLGSSASALY